MLLLLPLLYCESVAGWILVRLPCLLRANLQLLSSSVFSLVLPSFRPPSRFLSSSALQWPSARHRGVSRRSVSSQFLRPCISITLHSDSGKDLGLLGTLTTAYGAHSSNATDYSASHVTLCQPMKIRLCFGQTVLHYLL